MNSGHEPHNISWLAAGWGSMLYMELFVLVIVPATCVLLYINMPFNGH
jgi:hypothetical protein